MSVNTVESGAIPAADKLEILKANHGFSFPHQWIDYATANNFERVKATWIRACPDCAAEPGPVLGQQVYYSTLMRLRECPCGLIWADAEIDPEVISRHFETAYKDEAYFARRGPIFAELADLIGMHTPQGGSVIDIGGGMGHLMDITRKLRPDLKVSVSDVSADSVAFCRNRFGIDATVQTLSAMRGRYSTAVLSDVLYYESDMRAAWDVLSRIADTLIIRGPNKLRWIRSAATDDPMQASVKYFQPEHKHILSRPYLDKRLRSVGFDRVQFLPSRPLPPKSSAGRAVSSAAHLGSVALHKLTGIVSSPAMIAIATKL